MITSMASKLFGMSQAQAHEKNVCIRCQEPIIIGEGSCENLTHNPELFFTEAGKREYAISAMCEKCFDSLFDEEEQ